MQKLICTCDFILKYIYSINTRIQQARTKKKQAPKTKIKQPPDGLSNTDMLCASSVKRYVHSG